MRPEASQESIRQEAEKMIAVDVPDADERPQSERLQEKAEFLSARDEAPQLTDKPMESDRKH